LVVFLVGVFFVVVRRGLARAAVVGRGLRTLFFVVPIIGI
jgi:hypothetical protein